FPECGGAKFFRRALVGSLGLQAYRLNAIGAQIELRDQRIELTVELRSKRAERFLPERALFVGARLVDIQPEDRPLARPRELASRYEQRSLETLDEGAHRVRALVLGQIEKQRALLERGFASPQALERLALGRGGRHIGGANDVQAQAQRRAGCRR